MAIISKPTDPRTSQIEGLPDLIIGNIPVATLKSIIRSMTMTDLNSCSTFEALTREYLDKTSTSSIDAVFIQDTDHHVTLTKVAHSTIERIRTMSGCGMYVETLVVFQGIIDQVVDLKVVDETSDIIQYLIDVDADIIEIMSGVQRTQQCPEGLRDLTAEERTLLEGLQNVLVACEKAWRAKGQEWLMARSLATVRGMLDPLAAMGLDSVSSAGTIDLVADPRSAKVEKFEIGRKSVSRIFSGLWQLASPEFGVASLSKINKQFAYHAQAGLASFDMADHYGDAEILFVRLIHPFSGVDCN
jgi:hypothetical protein